MKLPTYAVRIILALIFLAAAGVRFSSTSESRYPYFRDESAATYNDALSAARGTLGEFTHKSNWPEGYRPALVRPAGVAFITGQAIRLSNWLSDTDTRTTTRRLWVFAFSICAVLMYYLTFRLWRSQTAGLLAALLVAFYPQVVEATNGSELNIVTMLLPVFLLHVLSLLRLSGGSTVSGAAGAAMAAAVLLYSWELSSYYTVIVVLAAVFFYPLDSRQRRIVAVSHAAVFVLVALTDPWSRETRLVFSWQSAVLISCAVVTFLTVRFPGPFRAAVFVLLTGAALTAGFSLFRSGAGTDLPALEYFYYRLRFLFERPASPSLLPEAVRHWWTAGHAPPGAHTLFTFFVPAAILGAASLLAARALARPPRETAGGGDPRPPGIRANVALATAVTAAGFAAFLLDRDAIAPALAAAAPLLGLSGSALENRYSQAACRPLLAAGLLVVFLQLLWPMGVVNPTYRLARLSGIAHRDKTSIMWVSLANTDKELVRFVATRTRTHDPFLGRPGPTTLLQTFAGRTSVLSATGRSRARAARHAAVTRLFYGDEEQLYRYCEENEIRYVLYSIDYLLDTTRYSPAYLAGVAVVPESCVSKTMHFSPETLSRFSLVYENDFYRLFRVTGKPEPIFATDHPPVFQKEILDLNSDSYDSFRDRIGQLIYAYGEAVQHAAAGRYDEALYRFTWCLRQAPRFTRARVAAGSVFLQMDQPQQAYDVLKTVMQYAPDNPDALYYTADALSRLERKEEALALLGILYTVSRDQEQLDKARLLEALIKRSGPASPGDEITPPGTND
jgi:tetratricopeptide (TPR) repeat protein